MTYKLILANISINWNFFILNSRTKNQLYTILSINLPMFFLYICEYLNLFSIYVAPVAKQSSSTGIHPSFICHMGINKSLGSYEIQAWNWRWMFKIGQLKILLFEHQSCPFKWSHMKVLMLLKNWTICTLHHIYL